MVVSENEMNSLRTFLVLRVFHGIQQKLSSDKSHKSQNIEHRITEQFGLKRASEGHLGQAHAQGEFNGG